MNSVAVPRKSPRLLRLFIAALTVWLLVSAGIMAWITHENQAANTVLSPDGIAPAWTLTAQDGRTFHSADYAQRAVALAFLPALDSDSEAQLKSLRAKQGDFDRLGVKVFAVTPASRDAALALHDRLHLDFPILSDTGGGVARLYGAAAANGAARRISYVMGTNNRVLLPITQVRPLDHGQQLYELTQCCLDNTPLPPSKLIGKRVADFSLPRTDTGATETLYGDNRQTATVVFVMSARCPCSARYDARYGQIARMYTAKGVRFLGMNANDGETASEIAAKGRAEKYGFPILQDKNAAIADKIGAQVTPEVFVLDRAGILRYHGRIDDSRDVADVKQHDLQNALDFLLAGKNPLRGERSAFGCAIIRKELSAGR